MASVYEWATKDFRYEELFVLVYQILEYADIFKSHVLDLKDKLDDENNHEFFTYGDGVRRLLLILEKYGIIKSEFVTYSADQMWKIWEYAKIGGMRVYDES